LQNTSSVVNFSSSSKSDIESSFSDEVLSTKTFLEEMVTFLVESRPARRWSRCPSAVATE
jgi:hypothetical protein